MSAKRGGAPRGNWEELAPGAGGGGEELAGAEGGWRGDGGGSAGVLKKQEERYA